MGPVLQAKRVILSGSRPYSRVYRFGTFEFDPQGGELRKGGLLLHIPDQSLEILALLLEHPGEVVGREAISAKLWPNGTVVQFDHSISVAVRRLREALSDSAETPRFVETLPRHGYRFLARVERVPPPEFARHYRMLHEVGRGAMGVVYAAEDVRLRRRVALKFLPEELAGHPPALERFRREAQSLAALNHPGICTLFGIEQYDGRNCLVMEYLEGRPLSRLLEGRPLELGVVLDIAIQVADALASAHRAGIIHRDLKPTNIMACDDGRAKILDFGVAKLAVPAGGTRRPSGRTSSPVSKVLQADLAGFDRASTSTLQGLTEAGSVVGTVAYMSPEQAEGKDVDERADIFSFGAVLYEMVTGRRVCSGETRLSTLAALLRVERTPVFEADSISPPKLNLVIKRCLRKRPEQRFHSMAEVKTALEEVQLQWRSSKTVSAPRRFLHLLAKTTSAALLLLAVAGIAYLWRSSRTGARRPPLPLLTRLTSDSGLHTTPAISPDGKLLAYASDRSGENNLDIWVQPIAAGDAVRLTHDPADDTAPSFSPDSGQIAFRSERDGGGIYVLSTLGGEERLLVRHGRYPRFSPDGTWIAFESEVAYELGAVNVISAMGGPTRRIARELDSASHPIWSGDGKRILLLGRNGPLGLGEDEWWIAPVNGGPAIKTGAMGALRRQGFDITDPPLPPDDWVDDHVVFSFAIGPNTNLWRIKLPSATFQVEGAAERLTFGTGAEIGASIARGRQGTQRLVFASQAAVLNIWSLAVDANRGKGLAKLVRLTDGAANNGRPSVSADGKKMTFVSERSGNPDIWLKDLETGKERALAATTEYEHHPVISADGSTVVYSVSGPTRATYAVPTAGGGAEKLCEDCWLAEDLSADGRRLLFGSPGPAPKRLFTVFSLNLDSRKRSQLLAHAQQHIWGPRFSPDGKWIAFFVSFDSGFHVYVAPFREDAILEEKDWILVADQVAHEPRWSPDGNLLYYYSKRDGFTCLWAQHLQPATKRPLGAPFAVYHSHSVGRSIGGGFDEYVGSGVANGRIVLTQNELSGNIWMLEFPQQQ